MLYQPLPVVFKALKQPGIVRSAGWWLAHDHNIQSGQGFLVLPEAFPGQALESVPVDGAAGVPARYRHTQPRVIKTVCSGQNGEKAVF